MAGGAEPGGASRGRGLESRFYYFSPAQQGEQGARASCLSGERGEVRFKSKLDRVFVAEIGPGFCLASPLARYLLFRGLSLAVATQSPPPAPTGALPGTAINRRDNLRLNNEMVPCLPGDGKEGGPPGSTPAAATGTSSTEIAPGGAGGAGPRCLDSVGRLGQRPEESKGREGRQARRMGTGGAGGAGPPVPCGRSGPGAALGALGLPASQWRRMRA